VTKIGETLVNKVEVNIIPDGKHDHRYYPAGVRFTVLRYASGVKPKTVKLQLPDGLVGWTSLHDKHGNKLYKPAKKCLTPETQFHFHIMPSVIDMKVELPIALDLTEEQAIQLEDELHDALESVLAKFFNKGE